MIPSKAASVIVATLMLAAACAGPGASPTPAPTAVSTPAPTPVPTAASTAVCDNMPAGSEGDELAAVCAAGKIVMSTDPAYPPQSVLAPDDPLGYKGFDIDVGHEIANRLGVDISFETPAWEVLTAGSWNGRWDFSVGSMTITSPRQTVLDFTQPYYYTPAQLAVQSSSAITDPAGLAGKVICVGEGTTYLDWINGVLDFGSESPQTTAPAGSTATTLPSDRDCAVAWQSGRHDFDGWLSSLTTVQGAIDDGLPVKTVGAPVYYEPLAVAFDKSAPTHTALLAAVDQIVADMHADGTLTQLSMKWFNYDYTVEAGQ
ncbi:MAG: transporter substrate-binding domain-containing protein [Chloroflexota bacterium]